MNEKSNKLLFAIIALAMAMVIVAFVSEIVFRIDDKKDPKTGTQLNSRGFHDVEHQDLKESDHVVMLLGDSFIEGAGVDIKWTVGRRLQKFLRESGDYEVVAMGEPGAGQAREFQILKEYLPAVKPDMVVLAFLPANDVMNNSAELEPKKTKPFYELTDGELRLVTPGEAKKGESSFSRLLDEIGQRLDHFRMRRAKVKAGGGIPLDFYIYAEQSSPEWERAWEITFALISKIRQTAADAGARFAVAVIADRWQTSSAAFQRLIETYPAMKEKSWDPQKPAKRIVGWCMENGIPVVDLHEGFRTDLPEELFLEDGHWNSAGHNLAARIIADGLKPLLDEKKTSDETADNSPASGDKQME